MQIVRFVHAADLHLDAAFSGIAQKAPADLVKQLHQAPFVALNRLVELCEREHPDFLILSGDIYNAEDHSLRAQLALRDACQRLALSQIPVFIVHGNHDPISSRLKSIRWSQNVTIFKEDYSVMPVFSNQDQHPLALIHGISHATTKEQRNLSQRFHRVEFQSHEEDCLQIGVLHCSLDSKDRYAPCEIRDLEASKLDYWALGHRHEYHEVCTQPLAIYPGCIQGLHINEQGEKGCVFVTATPDSKGLWSFSTSFYPLGPVIWRIIDVTLEEPIENTSLDKNTLNQNESSSVTMDWVEDCLHSALESAVSQENCETMIIRLNVYGRTSLDTFLRKEQNCEDILDHLRDWYPEISDSKHEVRLWVKDLQICTRPLLDRQQILERDDLLGEIFRLGEECRQSPEKMENFRKEAVKNLFEHPRARKILSPLTDEERLLDEAENLCVDLLESN